MTSPRAQVFLLAGLVVNLLALYLGRRLFFRSVNAISGFIVSYALVNYIGGAWMIMWPQSALRVSTQQLNPHLLTPRIMIEFSILLGASLTVFLFGYAVAYGLKLTPRSEFPRMPEGGLPNHVSVVRLLTVAILMALVLVALMGTPPLLQLLRGDVAAPALLQARLGYTGTGASYAFFVLSLTVFPFVSWLVYGVYLRNRTPAWRLLAYGLIALAGFMTATSLQKRPLIVHVLALVLVRGLVRRQPGDPIVVKGRTLGRIAALGTGLLVGLFYAFAGLGRTARSASHAVSGLLMLAMWDVVVPLARSYAIYIAIFPAILPHYGFGNISLVSRVFGGTFFSDSKAVFAIMYPFGTSDTEGGATVSAFGSLFGGFGLVGAIFGGWILGVLIGFLDRWLDRLEVDIGTLTLRVAMAVFGWYLAHASVFQAVFGYGAIPCVLIWLFVRKLPARREQEMFVPRPAHREPAPKTA